jgi:hypothetical protein
MSPFSLTTAAAALLALTGFTSAAQAKIEKIVRMCPSETGVVRLCPIFRASFAPPKGWSVDTKSAAAQGIHIFLPPGKTFRNAPAMIYGEARYNVDKLPLAQWVSNSDKGWLEAGDGAKVEELPAGDLGAGKREVIVHRYNNPIRDQPIEIIGYFAETDDDGNPFVVRLSLNGLSAKAVEDARPIFEEVLKSY